jgi:hypothetical protein
MGTGSPYLVYIVFFNAIAPARAVAPQIFFGVFLRVQQLCAVRRSTEAGPGQKNYMLGLGVLTFCHCFSIPILPCLCMPEPNGVEYVERELDDHCRPARRPQHEQKVCEGQDM